MDAEKTTNLCQLFSSARSNNQKPPTADTLANILKTRFLNDDTYTSISPFALVSLNPFKSLPHDADNGIFEYITESWSINTIDIKRLELNPHVWQLACRTYFYMRRTGQDQAIMFKWVDILLSALLGKTDWLHYPSLVVLPDLENLNVVV
jgi:Myosin head (motor domain)